MLIPTLIRLLLDDILDQLLLDGWVSMLCSPAWLSAARNYDETMIVQARQSRCHICCLTCAKRKSMILFKDASCQCEKARMQGRSHSTRQL
jgi:hypothetical protein